MGDVMEGAIDLREEAPTEVLEEEREGLRAAEAVLLSSLRPDETVVAYAEGLVRVVLQLFENCGVLLTDQRLLVAQRAWVNHWEVRTEFAVDSCEVLEDRVRFDASRLLAVQCGEVTRCFYFGQHWRGPAGAIAWGLSSGEDSDSYEDEQDALALLHEMAVTAGAAP